MLKSSLFWWRALSSFAALARLPRSLFAGKNDEERARQDERFVDALTFSDGGCHLSIIAATARETRARGGTRDGSGAPNDALRRDATRHKAADYRGTRTLSVARALAPLMPVNMLASYVCLRELWLRLYGERVHLYWCLARFRVNLTLWTRLRDFDQKLAWLISVFRNNYKLFNDDVEMKSIVTVSK